MKKIIVLSATLFILNGCKKNGTEIISREKPAEVSATTNKTILNNGLSFTNVNDSTQLINYYGRAIGYGYTTVSGGISNCRVTGLHGEFFYSFKVNALGYGGYFDMSGIDKLAAMLFIDNPLAKMTYAECMRQCYSGCHANWFCDAMCFSTQGGFIGCSIGFGGGCLDRTHLVAKCMKVKPLLQHLLAAA